MLASERFLDQSFWEAPGQAVKDDKPAADVARAGTEK